MKILKYILRFIFYSRDLADLILRVLAGGLMLTHGYAKLSSFSEKAEHFPDPLGIGFILNKVVSIFKNTGHYPDHLLKVGSALSLSLATFAEFFCAILLIVGLFTRFAALNILITMLVAGFIFHSADPFKAKELAFLYAAVFLYFTIVGGGYFSVDRIYSKQLAVFLKIFGIKKEVLESSSIEENSYK